MFEGSQPNEHVPKDPVRIVYHAENRTFAKLFNERSLEEVKHVVRRKLGLGPDIDVSLKQMGPDALLDLEDDNDFKAFCVHSKPYVSVDIQVSVDVGASQSSTVAATVASQPRRLSASNPVLSTSPPKPHVRPENVRSTKVSTPASIFLARKRKVSFGDADTKASDKLAERDTLAESKTAGTPVSSKSPGIEASPKKKQRNGTTKTKDGHAAEAVESSMTKTPSKPTPKKSAALQSKLREDEGSADDDDDNGDALCPGMVIHKEPCSHCAGRRVRCIGRPSRTCERCIKMKSKCEKSPGRSGRRVGEVKDRTHDGKGKAMTHPTWLNAGAGPSRRQPSVELLIVSDGDEPSASKKQEKAKTKTKAPTVTCSESRQRGKKVEEKVGDFQARLRTIQGVLSKVKLEFDKAMQELIELKQDLHSLEE